LQQAIRLGPAEAVQLRDILPRDLSVLFHVLKHHLFLL
jgi:hypothetical protein